MDPVQSLWSRAAEAAIAADRGLAAAHPLRLPIAVVGTRASGKSSLVNALLGEEVLPAGDPEGPTAHVVRPHAGSPPSEGARWCDGEVVVPFTGRWFLPADTDLVEVRVEEAAGWQAVADWLAECLAVVYVTSPLSVADELMSRVTGTMDPGTPLICVMSSCDTVAPNEARRARDFLKELLPDPWRTTSVVHCVSLEGDRAKLDVLPIEDELVLRTTDEANRRRAVAVQARRLLLRAERVLSSQLDGTRGKIAAAERECAEGEDALAEARAEYAALSDEVGRVETGIRERFSARMAQALTGIETSLQDAVSSDAAPPNRAELGRLLSEGLRSAWIGAATEAAEEFDELLRVCRKRVAVE